MEYCPGGELLDKVADKSVFGERETVSIMNDIIRAINHCH